MRNIIWLLTLALLPAYGGAARGADLTVAAAINKAGYQRMLSQRIVKSYLQLGLEVLPDVSALQLRQAVEEFDANLAQLKGFAPNAAIRGGVGKLEAAWQPLKAAATAPVDRQRMADILAHDARVLAAAEQLTRQIEDYGGLPLGPLVNTSGRQRMLSQRLAKLYMLRAWGFENSVIRTDLRDTGAEFVRALARLQAAPQNNYEINQELDAITLQWTWFQSALEQEGEYRSFLLVVADAADSMLFSLDNLTLRYEALAARR